MRRARLFGAALLLVLLAGCPASAPQPPLPPGQRALADIQAATAAYLVAIDTAAQAYHAKLITEAQWKVADKAGTAFLVARVGALTALAVYAQPTTPGDPAALQAAVDALQTALKGVLDATHH
jgi:hypothetical protein